MAASFGEEIATGGTLFGNALSLAAARATLREVLTNEAYDPGPACGIHTSVADVDQYLAVLDDFLRELLAPSARSRAPRANAECEAPVAT